MYLNRPSCLVPPIWRDDPPIYPRRRAPGPAHQRRRDRGRRAAGAAARAARGRRTSSSRSSRPTATAPPPRARSPRAGRCGSRRSTFGDGTVGYATRRHAGRLRALRRARADRRLHRRPDRLRHQPRLQPRRRHHLLRHGRGRARGRRARHPRHRGLPAVATRARWTSGSATRFDFETAAAFTARLVGGDRRRAAARRARCSTSTCRPARSTGVEVARLGKRIYRDQLSLVDEESGRKQYRIYGDAPDYERRGRAPTWRRSPSGADRGHAAALRPHRPARASRRCRPTTSRGCSRRRREEVDE